MVQKCGIHRLRLVVYPIIYKGFYILDIPGGAGFLPSTVGILTDLLRTDMRPKDIVLKVWFGLLHHTLTTFLDPEMWCSSYKTLFPYRTTLTPMNVEHSLQKPSLSTSITGIWKECVPKSLPFTELVSTSVPSTMLNWAQHSAGENFGIPDTKHVQNPGKSLLLGGSHTQHL